MFFGLRTSPFMPHTLYRCEPVWIGPEGAMCAPRTSRFTLGDFRVRGTMLPSTLATLSSQARRGFTLIEIALVLVVVGLLVSGGLLAVSPVIQSAKVSETKQKIATVEAAILGYVIQNGCLPCPAARATTTGVTNNGTADYAAACGSGGACAGAGVALVPWTSLGISENDATDAWGRRFTFAVNQSLTNDLTTDVARTASGTFPTPTDVINVENLVGAGTDLGYTAIAYLIVSHGKDGSFGESRNGVIQADLQTGTANQGQPENGDNDLLFAVGEYNSLTGATYFDDIVSFKSFQPLILSCGSGSCGNPS